jgi:uncharacterized protein (TIGR00251 family)
MKLLLADDDEDQLQLRSLTLTKAGYQVSQAADEQSAIQLAVAQTPDVAIVDLRIPTEEAGLRLIRALSKLDAKLRIIVLSGADPKRLEGLPERALVEAVITKGSASRKLVEYLKNSGGTDLKRKLAAGGQLVLEVKVIPRSSKSEIVEFLSDGAIKVKLAAVPEKGKANDELVALLADYFQVAKQSVELIAGDTSQRKRVRIRAT